MLSHNQIKELNRAAATLIIIGDFGRLPGEPAVQVFEGADCTEQTFYNRVKPRIGKQYTDIAVGRDSSSRVVAYTTPLEVKRRGEQLVEILPDSPTLKDRASESKAGTGKNLFEQLVVLANECAHYEHPAFSEDLVLLARNFIIFYFAEEGTILESAAVSESLGDPVRRNAILGFLRCHTSEEQRFLPQLKDLVGDLDRTTKALKLLKNLVLGNSNEGKKIFDRAVDKQETDCYHLRDGKSYEKIPGLKVSSDFRSACRHFKNQSDELYLLCASPELWGYMVWWLGSLNGDGDLNVGRSEKSPAIKTAHENHYTSFGVRQTREVTNDLLRRRKEQSERHEKNFQEGKLDTEKQMAQRGLRRLLREWDRVRDPSTPRSRDTMSERIATIYSELAFVFDPGFKNFENDQKKLIQRLRRVNTFIGAVSKEKFETSLRDQSILEPREFQEFIASEAYRMASGQDLIAKLDLAFDDFVKSKLENNYRNWLQQDPKRITKNEQRVRNILRVQLGASMAGASFQGSPNSMTLADLSDEDIRRMNEAAKRFEEKLQGQVKPVEISRDATGIQELAGFRNASIYSRDKKTVPIGFIQVLLHEKSETTEGAGLGSGDATSPSVVKFTIERPDIEVSKLVVRPEVKIKDLDRDNALAKALKLNLEFTIDGLDLALGNGGGINQDGKKIGEWDLKSGAMSVRLFSMPVGKILEFVNEDNERRARDLSTLDERLKERFALACTVKLVLPGHNLKPDKGALREAGADVGNWSRNGDEFSFVFSSMPTQLQEVDVLESGGEPILPEFDLSKIDAAAENFITLNRDVKAAQASPPINDLTRAELQFFETLLNDLHKVIIDKEAPQNSADVLRSYRAAVLAKYLWGNSKAPFNEKDISNICELLVDMVEELGDLDSEGKLKIPESEELTSRLRRINLSLYFPADTLRSLSLVFDKVFALIESVANKKVTQYLQEVNAIGKMIGAARSVPGPTAPPLRIVVVNQTLAEVIRTDEIFTKYPSRVVYLTSQAGLSDHVLVFDKIKQTSTSGREVAKNLQIPLFVCMRENEAILKDSSLFVLQDDPLDQIPQPDDCSKKYALPPGAHALALACALTHGDFERFARTWNGDEWKSDREAVLKTGLLRDFGEDESIIDLIRRGILKGERGSRILEPLVRSRMLTYALLFAREHKIPLGFQFDTSLGVRGAWEEALRGLFLGIFESPKVLCNREPPNNRGISIDNTVVQFGNCEVKVGGSARVHNYDISI